MKFNLYIAILFCNSVLLQAAEQRQMQNPLSESLSSHSHLTDNSYATDEKISQHVSTTDANRKIALMQCAQILTVNVVNTSKITKITRNMLLNVCDVLPHVLKHKSTDDQKSEDSIASADDKINAKVRKIQARFNAASCSSCYGCIPCWKNYSDDIIEQEAIDLKNLINKEIDAINRQYNNSVNYVASSSIVTSAPMASAVSQNPNYVEDYGNYHDKY